MSVVRNLIKSYGDFDLNIPYWEISDKGITALLGPSGAGKTSIFRTLLGLEEGLNLSWDFKGTNLCALPVEQRRLGVVFQNYELFPHLTAQANIWFAAHARKRPREEAQKDFIFLCESLGLTSLLQRSVQVLSGGEQQRVALARAIMGQPQFLFLDEPFSALDKDLKEKARELVKAVITEYKIPTLLITHDETDVRAICDYNVSIKAGRLV